MFSSRKEPHHFPFRTDTFPEAVAAVAAHAKGLHTEAEQFIVTVFDTLADKVARRDIYLSASFIEIRLPSGYDAAVEAFCEMRVLDPFLQAHGIKLGTWQSEIIIRPTDDPPAGSLGEVLLDNKRAIEIIKARRKTEADRKHAEWLAARTAAARKTQGLAERIRGR